MRKAAVQLGDSSIADVYSPIVSAHVMAIVSAIALCAITAPSISMVGYNYTRENSIAKNTRGSSLVVISFSYTHK